MEWFNQNAGVLVLLLLILSVIAFAVIIVVMLSLRNRIAVQRLKIVGFYSRDTESRENYAEFTVGNRSLNDVGVKEIGLQNGKINLDYTLLYMRKAHLTPGTRIVIDQRSSLTFRLTEHELSSVLLETPKGKKLHRLRLYVVDLTGNVYYGTVWAVRKMLIAYMKHLNEVRPVPAEEPAAPAQVPAPVQKPSPAQVPAPAQKPSPAQEPAPAQKPAPAKKSSPAKEPAPVKETVPAEEPAPIPPQPDKEKEDVQS